MVVSLKDVLHCESEYNRGAGCGKTARPDLCGVGLVTARSTTIIFLVLVVVSTYCKNVDVFIIKFINQPVFLRNAL